MSRIGKLPVPVPSGVNVSISDDNIITVKGPKGELVQKVNSKIEVAQEDGQVVFKRTNEQKQTKAMHGLYRSLVNNMVEGVTNGYEKKLELIGVGYKATMSGQVLEMDLGYSHKIYFQLPQEIKATAETVKGKPPVVTLQSIDKQLIGQIAAKIKSLRKIEPYKGKGIKFVDEYVRRKAGKTGK